MERTARWSSNPFIMMAGLYVTIGLALAILHGLQVLPYNMPGPSNLNWIRVHVITVGTISQVVFAFMPGFLSRRLAIADRTVREGWVQWLLLNGGFLLVIVGLVGVDSWTASLGATLILVAVYRLLAGTLHAWQSSGKPKRESFRFYATAPLYLLFGITMAISLLFNWWAPGGRIGVLEAHVHANVWGFLALIVAGMLFDLFPALAGGPMARPQWISWIYHLLNLGALGLVVGPWVNVHALTLGGLLFYLVGTGALVANLIMTLYQHRRITPPAIHLVMAYLWFIVPAFFAPFILLGSTIVHGPAVEAAATQGLINGWVMGVIMGALPRMLRARRNPDGPLFGEEDGAADGSWLSVVALNLGVALVWSAGVITLPAAVQFVTLLGYGLIAVAWVPFLGRLWRILIPQETKSIRM